MKFSLDFSRIKDVKNSSKASFGHFTRGRLRGVLTYSRYGKQQNQFENFGFKVFVGKL